MFKILQKFVHRAWIIHLLRRGKKIPIEKAIGLWRKSNIVYLGPTGPSARITPELRLLRSYLDSTDMPEETLLNLLKHESASVAGYAFEILLHRNPVLAEAALPDLEGRKGDVSLGFTCFFCYTSIHEHAQNRLIQARAT